jgi:hypothetical protein
MRDGSVTITEYDDLKNGCISTIMVMLCLLIITAIYFGGSPIHKVSKTKIYGIITNKLPNDRVVIKTIKNEDVYTISNELYINKKIGDSIILILKK